MGTAVAGAVLAFAVPASAQTDSQEFQNVDETESFTVPADVCALTIEARGAGGGGLENNALTGPGGTGGLAIATVPVVPGDELLVAVGERGVATFTATGGPGGVSGGQPSGGDGGDSIGTGAVGASGGGGSSSVVRAPGGEPLVVAGGGGGGGITRGASGAPGAGGDGGGSSGDDGTSGGGDGPGSPGDGGTPAAPGLGGPLQFPGETGTGVVGGDGADVPIGTVGNGGGGAGGGYLGGGGAGGSNGSNAGGGGGGGGSGFAAADATDVTLTIGGNPDLNREGLVVISWTPEPGCDVAPPAPSALVVEPAFTG
jgi:hypothetical protein